MLKEIVLAFIPIFVAVDAVGVLPIFVSLTHGLTKKQKTKIILQSMVTATYIAVGFIYLGRAIFRILGISMADFMIAGGAILFSIAIIDIVTPGKRRRIPTNELGAVPLGTPLIVGPAVLATSLIIINEYGAHAALISVIANILLAGIIFYFSAILIKFIGDSGAKALSKVMSLLLGAIAVMIIRKGLMQLFG